MSVNLSVFRLLPHIRGNVGLVFTKVDLSDVRKVIDNNKVISASAFAVIISFQRRYQKRHV